MENPNQYEHVNHKDGNKLNNHVNNLEWISDQENQEHAVDNNLIRNKTHTYVGKLTKKQRDEIKVRHKNGESSRKIAPDFNVTHTTILSVINDKYDYGEHYSNDYEFFMLIINRLNELREEYLETENKEIWYSLIKLLPESWLQKRTVTMSYENLLAMCSKGQRRFHKLNEWSGQDDNTKPNFIAWVRTLPYAQELIFIDEVEE